jgi:hypothetical protein
MRSFGFWFFRLTGEDPRAPFRLWFYRLLGGDARAPLRFFSDPFRIPPLWPRSAVPFFFGWSPILNGMIFRLIRFLFFRQ